MYVYILQKSIVLYMYAYTCTMCTHSVYAYHTCSTVHVKHVCTYI